MEGIMDNNDNFIKVLERGDATEVLKFLVDKGKRKPYSPIYILTDEDDIERYKKEIMGKL